MLRNINYKREKELLDYTSNLNKKIKDELSGYFVELPKINDINLKQQLIDFPRLVEYLNSNDLFQSFRAYSDDNLPLDIYLHLHFIFDENVKDCNSYKDVLNKIQSSFLYKTLTQLREQLEFTSLSHVLILGKKPWNNFTKNFDGSNWHEIFLLAELLPLSDTSIDQFIDWISIIIKKQEKDGAIGEIGQYVYEWVIFNESVYKEIDNKLIQIAINNRINRFFTPLLKGLKEKVGKENRYFTSALKEYIDPSNALNILYALGAISVENDETKLEYYNLLLDELNRGKLPTYIFINLCNYFALYKQELFLNIKSILPTSGDPEILNSIIELLINDENDKIDKHWKNDTYFLLFSKEVSGITKRLNHLLYSISEKDIELAYGLFEYRLKIMTNLEFLENAFLNMIRKNTLMFQMKLINWFNQEDSYLHTAIRKICSIHQLEKNLFNIPPTVFNNYNVRDKLYISYKIVGYVYSMDELQRLTLSLIKSVNTHNEVLKESMHYILSEYLVYNYRSTLQLIKDALSEEALNDFAKKLFTQIIEEYDSYFSGLKSISVDKELRPYKEHILLKSFYMRRQLAALPRVSERSSLASFFKNTQLNSNKWAVRRPNQLKHEVQELAHISISTEFPSGEYLNPIYQEYIRRTYQNIKKDEINIH